MVCERLDSIDLQTVDALDCCSEIWLSKLRDKQILSERMKGLYDCCKISKETCASNKK